MFRCSKCEVPALQPQHFGEIVRHCINNHSNEVIAFEDFSAQMCEKTGMIRRTKYDYSLIPANLNGVQAVPNETNRTIELQLEEPKEPPKKRQCLVQTDNFDVSVYDDLMALRDRPYFDRLRDSLRLLRNGTIPETNIAFQLFLDVVNWFGLENTSNMRYSEDVRLFWRTGYLLFHGKFLRFMSGPKCKGQATTDPTASDINFAVPTREMLGLNDTTNNVMPIKSVKPGLLIPLIDVLKENTPNYEEKSFKICVDGKKINPSTESILGQINLFGFEDKPTATDLEKELVTAKTLVETTLEAAPHPNVAGIIRIIQNLSIRAKQLRLSKVKKTLLINKLLEYALVLSKDWRKSKYCLVISAIYAQLYQIDGCLKAILDSIDKLAEVCCTRQQTANFFVSEGLIDLNQQENWICLQGQHESFPVYPPMVKQRSEHWYMLRKEAALTGSTMHKAIGLDTVKEQVHHFDVYVLGRTPEPPSDLLKKLWKHGSDHEIHAMGTFLGKVLPVIAPNTTFVEVGCYAIHKDDVKCIVSPDGCLINAQGVCIAAIEIKCPYPGKEFAAPVHYDIPWYYAVQLLAEMTVLGVNTLYFISYSNESTTVHRVEYDAQLWELIWDASVRTYGGGKPKRPSKTTDESKVLRDKLKTYVKSPACTFVLEVASLQSVVCTHVIPESDLYPNHVSHKKVALTSKRDNVDCLSLIPIICDIFDEVAIITRPRATELMVFMMSDLDRLYKIGAPHAVPIAYGLAGCSLKTDIMRNMIHYVLDEVRKRGMHTPLCSHDGQFYRLVVRDRKDKPLTLLQLQKDVYNEAKRTKKQEILKFLLDLNVVEIRERKPLSLQVSHEISETNGSSVISVGGLIHPTSRINPRCKDVLQLVANKLRGKTMPNNVDLNENLPDSDASQISTDASNGDEILHLLPTGATATLDKEMIQVIESLNTNAVLEKATKSPDNEPCFETELSEQPTIADEKAESRLQLLLDILKSSPKTKGKWDMWTCKQFATAVHSPKSINSVFNINDIRLCLGAMKAFLKENHIEYNSKMLKADLVNALAKVVGCNSNERLETTSRKCKRSPKSLRMLCIGIVDKNFSKDALNILYADALYENALANWKKTSPIRDSVSVVGNGVIDEWFSQPEWYEEDDFILFSVLDSEHLLVNSRSKCCSTGMKASKVEKEAFMKVARDNEKNKTGLNLSMVADIIDKQSCAFALTTFGEKVEQEMRRNGDVDTADFVRLIRRWYEAEDLPGLSVDERIKRRLDMREWLLRGVNFRSFPPPGGHVRDIPIVIYEGLITGIERRIQIIPFVKGGHYNVRALSSLDAENYFSSFQDMDPRGKGILSPQDIPIALSHSCQLIHTRFNPNRTFSMCTSKSKVYPEHELLTYQTGDTNNGEVHSSSANECVAKLRDVRSISPRNHPFDESNIRRGQRRKMDGIVSGPNAPAKGAQPLRLLRYKTNEAKIPAHVRLDMKMKVDERK